MHRPAWLIYALSAAVLLGAVESADGAVTDMQSLVGLESSLLHWYTFDGATDAERRLDGVASGAVDLTEIAYGAGDVGQIVYGAPAFDVSSSAYIPQRVSRHGAGAGLRSPGNISLTDTITIEALVRPQNLEAGGAVGYAVMSGVSPGRGYYLMQLEQAGGDALATVVGDNFTEPDNRRPLVDPFTPNHWYYVASTFDRTGGNTVINSYVADISAGETTLTKVLDNAPATGVFNTSQPLGVGVFANTSGATDEAFKGAIDEVAVYSSLLSQSALQSHLDALLAPTATNVARMRQAVAATPGLIHHYPLEGDATERLLDQAGSHHLTEVGYGSVGTAATLDFTTGVDASTMAVNTLRLSRTSGEGGRYLRTQDSLALGSTLTVEGLFKPENIADGDTIAYGIGHRGTPARAYFIAELAQPGDDALGTIIGDNFTEADNRRLLADPFVPGHWYYVANTYEEVGGNTVINSYIADLTAGETELTQVLANATATGTFSGASNLGIGGFGVSVQEAWSGALDEIALYDRVLDLAEIQLHFSALNNVPEPSTLALALVGLVGGALARRRKR